MDIQPACIGQVGYGIFEGNKAQTKTLLPVLEKFKDKFKIEKPMIVADSALLSERNIEELRQLGYEFILGGRIKNENDQIKKEILKLRVTEKEPAEIKHKNGRLYKASRQRPSKSNKGIGTIGEKNQERKTCKREYQ